MKLYCKKQPQIIAHEIDFHTDKGIRDILELLETTQAAIIHPAGNKYPVVQMPNGQEYSQGDYLCCTPYPFQWRGMMRETFEREWEESE